MSDLPKYSGDVSAYGFYVEFALQFLCDICGQFLECPITDSDDDAPRPPWATQRGVRGMLKGWYVPPLTAEGALQPVCLCPDCARKRGLVVQEPF